LSYIEAAQVAGPMLMPAPFPDPLQVAEPQRLLLSVLSSLPDTAVVIVDRQLVLRFVCGRALEDHGWDPGEMIGRPLSDVLGEHAEIYVSHYRIALSGGSSSLEAPNVAGTRFYRTEFFPLRLTGEAVAGAVAVVRDISQHLADRAALERSEREFRLLAENATDMISRHALDSTWLYASPSVASLLGWAPEELVGRSPFAMIHPADQAHAAQALARLNADAEPHTVRYRMAHSDGRWIWVETLARQVVAADGTPELHASTRDISVQVAAEVAEREAQERFRLAFDDAPIGMALVDLQGRVTRVNAAMCDLLERGESDLLGRTIHELTAPEDLAIDVEHMRRLTAGEIRHYALEKRYLAPDGGHIWAQLSVSLMRDADGNPEGYIAQVQDIGERRRMQDALQHLADHDMLSGLWNRRRFEEQLRHEIARFRRHGPSTALLLFDLDGLKGVNDTFGHRCGDELIRAVARAVRGRLRETDAVARIGGDEFAVLLPGVEEGAALAVADNIRAAVRALSITAVGGADATTTTSIGVAMFGPDLDDAQALLAAADRAMYAVKTAGGDGVAAAR
jgi:diguanylate cyclase (GGDEF)-like protein/PAS domain S-box-containing protein